jgi:hypothetical protein
MKTINAISLIALLVLSLALIAGCQQSLTPTTECQQDSDCVPDQCCHATDCIPSSQELPCNELCTDVCVPGTIDCGGSCTCDAGQCTAHYEIKVTQSSCAVDSDCACGRNLATGECFYGNKDYVNVSQQCPDYCTGIAANLEIKCINNTCTQVKVENNQPSPSECTTDNDCVPADCCHADSCVLRKDQPDCTGVMCTMNCQPQTMDCGGYCACINGKCVAELNDL